MTKEQIDLPGPVKTYYMPLEEVHRRYGVPGELEEGREKGEIG